MSISTTIRSYYGRARRIYRAFRVRLRRARVAVALLAMLTIALGEPLLCILHCQIWIPFAYQSYFAGQHAHMHHTSPHAMLSAEAAPNESVAASALPVGDANCFMLRSDGNHDGMPVHVPPSPVHDLLPTLVGMVILMFLIGMYLSAAPRDPPNAPHPLLLRPPIPFAV